MFVDIEQLPHTNGADIRWCVRPRLHPLPRLGARLGAGELYFPINEHETGGLLSEHGCWNHGPAVPLREVVLLLRYCLSLCLTSGLLYVIEANISQHSNRRYTEALPVLFYSRTAVDNVAARCCSRCSLVAHTLLRRLYWTPAAGL